MSRIKTLAEKAGLVIGVALTWWAAFSLNDAVFSQAELSARAHWVFLPAALRVISVLVFEELGAAGLIIGAYITLPHETPNDLPYELMLSVTSGFAPLVAIWLARTITPVAADLSNLRGKHIILLSVVSAAANSLLVNATMALAGRLTQGWIQVVAIFVGDMLGTAIVLGSIAILLSTLHKSRNFRQ